MLTNPKTGHRFMPDYDERAELAPRDIVARAIDSEIKRDGLDYVHLDISHREPEFVKAHFPNIYEKLLGLGIDITKRADPGRPGAALYLRRRAGRHRRPHRRARASMRRARSASRGSTAPTGWRRTRLLECFVFGEAAARHILAHFDDLPAVPAVRAWDESRVTDSDEEVVIQQCWGEIRRFMWNFVGIVRIDQAARTRQAPHRPAAPGSRRLLPPLPRHARPDRTAQPRRSRRPHHPHRRSAATKAAACITRSIIPSWRRKRSTRCWSLRPCATCARRGTAPPQAAMAPRSRCSRSRRADRSPGHSPRQGPAPPRWQA